MTQTTPVDPLPGLLPWFGGKRNLARRLIERIEATPHVCYAEPFLGMGGVFLRRRNKPPTEAVNDLNKEVATLFRVVRRHPDALLAELKGCLNSRADFERLKATPPEVLADIERASRFYVIQTMAFAGKTVTPSFGVSTLRPGRFDPDRVATTLGAVHRRLAATYIECLPYAEFIRRWDRPDTLFYVDPPYFGHEGDYGKGMFGRHEFEAMAEQLAAIRGRFVLSLNDTPDVRRIFGRFDIHDVEVTYTAGGGANTKKAAEVVITGGGGA